MVEGLAEIQTAFDLMTGHSQELAAFTVLQSDASELEVFAQSEGLCHCLIAAAPDLILLFSACCSVAKGGATFIYPGDFVAS